MSHKVYCYAVLLNLKLLPFSCKVEQNKAEIECRIDYEGNQFGEIIQFVKPGFPFSFWILTFPLSGHLDSQEWSHKHVQSLCNDHRDNKSFLAPGSIKIQTPLLSSSMHLIFFQSGY